MWAGRREREGKVRRPWQCERGGGAPAPAADLGGLLVAAGGGGAGGGQIQPRGEGGQRPEQQARG